MVQHLVLITTKVKAGMAEEALKLFERMHPAIRNLTRGLRRAIFFRSIEDPERVGCVCLWASR